MIAALFFAVQLLTPTPGQLRTAHALPPAMDGDVIEVEP